MTKISRSIPLFGVLVVGFLIFSPSLGAIGSADDNASAEAPQAQEIPVAGAPMPAPEAPPEAADTLTVDQRPTVVRQVPYAHNTVLYEFSNGLELFVARRHDGQATVRAYVSSTGSQNEGKYLGTGISHLTEHLVCGGSTSRRSKAESTAQIASLGGASNAFTSQDITGYYIDCSSDHIPAAMDLITDWLQNAEFAPNEFASEKRVILQELLDASDNPSIAAAEALSRTVYREHPYRHPIGGYPDRFETLTRDDVQEFYRSRYTPNNTLFYVAGNVVPDEIAAALAERYAGTKRGAECDATLPAEPPQIAPREFIRAMQGNTFRLTLAWPTVALSSPDMYPLDTLSILLTGGESARLNRRIKNEKGIGAAFYSASLTPAGLSGMFLIQTITMPNELEATQAALLEEIRKLTDIAVSPEELAKAKKQCQTSFVFARESLSDVADSTATNYLLTGDPDFDTRYLEGIERVTAEDIRRVVREYFRPERLNRVLIAPLGMEPKNVAADSASEPEPIEAYQLPTSGMRVLMKKSDALPMVNIQVYILGSALIDNDKTAGQSAFLAEMLDKGTATRSRTEIENYFDSIGGSLSFRVGRSTLYASATVLKEDFPAALTVLTDCLLRPAFPQNEFDKVKKQMFERIAHRGDSPISELLELFSETLPSASPHHLLLDGTNESIERVTPESLRALHARIVTPENMILTVFGDIDPSDAARRIRDLYDTLPKGGAQAISFDRHNELLGEFDRHKQTQRESATAIVAWPTISVRDTRDHAALTLLQTILGGYGYPGGRLFEELRGEGLVYRLTVEQMIGPAPGYFYVMFETRPDAVLTTLDSIDRALERIKKEDVSPEEMEAAKERIIAYHAQEAKTDADRAAKAALDDLYGLGYNNDEQFEQRIRDVTADDLFRVARKYFNQRAIISTSPNPTR